jgi:predicted TIM-barrel fold metal-dependent hydrolase
VELIGQSGLTDEELDKVFFANAARLLKLPG